MKTTIGVSACLLVLCQLVGAVAVTEGDFRFSLDSVKVMAALVDTGDTSLGGEARAAAAVCTHPARPDAFTALCARKDAGAAMARLVSVASRSDACQICESVACTDC